MTSRKDAKGRVLYKGESQRADYYIYQYTDIHRKRRVIYAKDLPELREKEQELLRDIQDKLDVGQRSTLTLNEAFDRYFATRTDLKHSTRVNYEYLYGHYVRPGFGTWKLASLCYSDFKTFYLSLAMDYKLSKKTLFLIHSILSQVMKVAVRDNIIRQNPAEGVVRELAKRYGWTENKRHALTPEEQQIFLSYAMKHAEFEEFVPLLIVLIGTGCRIGEALGLRWKEDVDFENESISISHSLQYRKLDSGKTGYYISTPKTLAGHRIIPMISQVKEALLTQQKLLESRGQNNMSPSPDNSALPPATQSRVQSTASSEIQPETQLKVQPKSQSETQSKVQPTAQSETWLKVHPETQAAGNQSFQSPVVDGYTNFVFLRPNGDLYHSTTVNRAIRRIITHYNEEESTNAALEKRPPVLLPMISCHHLRHTFCSRLCENETNLKIIQDIMGHANITTTMNRYAEANERKKAERMHSLESKIMIM